MKTLLQDVLGYVSRTSCRQLAILEYFSDEAERALGPCGLCDRCRPEPASSGWRAASVSAPPGPVSADPHLFEQLRRLRLELAEEEGVAPFVIFHDKTLRTLAGLKPTTLSALSDIPGIGDVKIERYGRRVLAVLRGDR